MDDRLRDIWNNGLAAKGMRKILEELKKNPGEPTDEFPNVVCEGPHPTRDYCLRWCLDQFNKQYLNQCDSAIWISDKNFLLK